MTNILLACNYGSHMKINNLKDTDFPPNPFHKPGYRLEFSDDFRAGKLDTIKWLPFYIP